MPTFFQRAVVSLVPLAMSLQLAAQSAPRPEPETPWQPLFNGTDLTGWVKVGNEKVFFHSDFKPGTADVSQGLQFEIGCTLNHHTAGIYGDGRQWIVWPSPENETVVRPTDWNDLSVRVVGNRYVARLNGVPMVDFTDPTPKSFDGFISLQLHAGGAANMRFKDIYIRDLSRR